MVHHLKQSLLPRWPQTFHLTEGDAVEKPLADLVQPVDGSFKVVANLPYAISTPWMDAICAGPHPEIMVLMLQREAAERLTAEVGTKHWSAVTAQVALAFDKVKLHPVPGQSFNPPPKWTPACSSSDADQMPNALVPVPVRSPVRSSPNGVSKSALRAKTSSRTRPMSVPGSMPCRALA
jgi:hypothetical protein